MTPITLKTITVMILLHARAWRCGPGRENQFIINGLIRRFLLALLKILGYDMINNQSGDKIMQAFVEGHHFILSDDDGNELTRVRLRTTQLAQKKADEVNRFKNIASKMPAVHPWNNFLVEKSYHTHYENKGVDLNDKYLLILHDEGAYLSTSDVGKWIDENGLAFAGVVSHVEMFDASLTKHRLNVKMTVYIEKI